MIQITTGWRSVIGAFLIQLCLGNLYLWGILTIYVTSYLRKYDDTISYYDTITIYATSLGVQGIMMIFAGYLETYFASSRAVVAFGCLFVLLACFIASISTDLMSYIIFYGGFFGSGFGIAYSSSIVLCVRFNPQQKSLVTGCIVAGIGIGAFAFGTVVTSIINPEAEPVGPSGYYDPDSVQVQRVPLLFFSLGCIDTCLMTIGLCLMAEPPQVESDEEYKEDKKSEWLPIKDEEEVSSHSNYLTLEQEESRKDEIGILGELTPSQLIQSDYAWQLSSCYCMTTVGGMYLSGEIAVYGSEFYSSTVFLTTIVAIANIFNGLSRPLWGMLADHYGALNVIQVMSAVFSMIIFSYHYISSFQNSVLFAIWTFSMMFCIGGNFCLYMPISITMSGKKCAIGNYGLIFLGLSICEYLNIVTLAKLRISFRDACMCMGLLCFLGCLNLNYLAVRLKNYSDAKNNESKLEFSVSKSLK